MNTWKAFWAGKTLGYKNKMTPGLKTSVTSHLTVADVCSAVGQNVFSFMTLHSKEARVFPMHLYKSTHSLEKKCAVLECWAFVCHGRKCFPLKARSHVSEWGGEGCYGAELNSLCAIALERGYPSTLWFLWRPLSSSPPTLIMCLFLRAMTMRRSTFHSLLLPALTSFSYLGYVGLITNKKMRRSNLILSQMNLCFSSLETYPAFLGQEGPVRERAPLSQMRQVSSSVFGKPK